MDITIENSKENNKVKVTGKVISKKPKFVYMDGKAAIYLVTLSIRRLSGTEDIIPVYISEEFEQFDQIKKGVILYLKGEYRSFNKRQGSKSKLFLYIFAKKIKILDANLEKQDINKIVMYGFVCKNPVYRLTPLGKEIVELMIAVNRNDGKSDYIPCILWDEAASEFKDLLVGQKLKLVGRIQSREYLKKISEKEDILEKKIAYEVSVAIVEKIL